MPILLPEAQNALPDVARAGCTPQVRPCRKKLTSTGELLTAGAPVPRLMPPTRRGARFGPPSSGPEPVVEKAKPQKKKREKVKADPAHVAAARELRDRWLERVNSDAGAD